jgi:hypothetical protein
MPFGSIPGFVSTTSNTTCKVDMATCGKHNDCKRSFVTKFVGSEALCDTSLKYDWTFSIV